MDEERQENAGSCRTLQIVLAVILLPLLHVLASGPITWLAVKGYIDPDGPIYRALLVVYLPMAWLVDHGGIVGSAIKWYVHLWIP